MKLPLTREILEQKEWLMKPIILALSLSLSGCGTSPTSGDAAPQETKAKTPAPEKEATVQTTEEAAPTAPEALPGALGPVTVLFLGEELPDCAEANHGQTFYVEAEDLFYVCDASGWAALDLRGQTGAGGATGAAGPAGADGVDGTDGSDGLNGLNGSDGVDGTDGAIGPQGPQGATGSVGATGAVGTTGSTGATGATGLTGATGSQGSAGTDGVDGSDGADGQDGATGLGGIGTYNAANTLVGLAAGEITLGNSAVIFAGGSIASINYANGTFFGSYAYTSTQVMTAYCLFEANNCSGTCYAGNTSNNQAAMMKGAVFYTGSLWYRAAGTEVDTGAKTMRSMYTNGACLVSTVNATKSFAVTTGWAFPVGLSMPLGALHPGEVTQ